MEIQDDKIGIFQNYLSTLKKTSLDKGSGQKKIYDGIGNAGGRF